MIKLLSLTSWRRLAQGSFLALAVQLLATGSAWALCDVSLVSINPSNQAVLKANCGPISITGINWFQDGNSLTGGTDLALTPAVTGTDIFYTVPLIFSNAAVHSYTATGNLSRVGSGTPVTIAIAPPALNVAASAGGTVVSTPPGINACKNSSGTCVATYSPGATVSLTATADPGFTFSGWGGDCSGMGICTVGMTSVRTVAATFTNVPTYAVTGVANPSAGGGVNCTSPVTSGGTSTCTITTTQGWTLTGASSNTCGGNLSGNTFTTGGVTSACTVTVNFSQTPTSFPVTGIASPSAGGTVTCNTPVTQNSTTTCAISANANWTLTGVVNSTCGGSLFAGSTSGTFTTGLVNAACTVTVNFQQGTSQSYAVTGVANPAAGGSVSCTSPVVSGGTSACTITTNSGYTLTGATSTTCGGPFSGSSFSTGAVTSACTVTATFSGSQVGNCGPGEVFGAGDAAWTPNTHIFPSQAITASGDFGRAISFVANSTLYPNGITLSVFDQSSALLPKDAVISACAHNFTNPADGKAGGPCVKSGIGTQADFLLKFGPAQRPYDCSLTPGQTYYLNFRDYSVPRGTVSSQFVDSPR